MKRTLLFILAVSALFTQGAYAQLTPSSNVVDFSVVHSQDKYQPGQSFQLLFKLKFKEGWHGQSHEPTMEGLIPTELKLVAGEGISFGRVAYPQPKMEKFEFSEKPLATYEGVTYIGATVALPQEMAPGERTIDATLHIQACNDKSCLIPSDIALKVPLLVAASGEKVNRINTDVYAANQSLFIQKAAAKGESGGGDIKGYFESKGLFLTFIFIFLGGLALNLTPCVYPLIPITVSYFGGKSEEKKGGLVAHAVMYVFGMAVMYSFLGLFAALTGSLFGAILQHWAVILLIVAVLVGLSLSMFGVYELRVPNALAEIGGKNRKGFFGTFMMGLTVGIVAAPCIGPFVLGLLTFVGEKGDPLLGFSMFFVLALGLGLPFMILAIFSGAITFLPRSGVWMLWVRQVFGVVLLAMAVYFVAPLIPKEWYRIIFGAFLVGGGVFLGWLSKVKAQGMGFKTARWAVGVLFIAIGAFFLYPARQHTAPVIAWKKATSTAIDAAASSRKAVIVDFTADWCLPCKELEHFTFSDAQVIELSKNVVMLRADVTKSGETEVENLKKHFNVAGVPTLIFLDSKGRERSDLRFVGFVDAQAFLQKMKTLLE